MILFVFTADFCFIAVIHQIFNKCKMSNIPKVPSTDRNALNSLWGKLASEILMQNWEAAMEDLTRLRETVDNNSVSSPLQSLQQRTWLIHWSLFVFFNHPKGRDNIIDLFLYQPQ
ncbi:Eukaryotic translation initiation factor 3 subunit E [Ataeniobius toweri]|uniref:Eukaryotic translation initiation factor 3 subunit E n=1 Tax=Ataeniobius toweri TaxID=208326 RepID=A0ABU7ARD8_9TELE|nr:Eukaryotic translation initiation factor 3 subunit E [Ataeniobius toweri]